MSRRRAKTSEFLTQIRLRFRVVGNAAEAFGLHSVCGSDLVGNPLKSANAAHLPDEYFVIRVDGRVKSHHRRFLDLLGKACSFGISFRSTTSKSTRCMREVGAELLCLTPLKVLALGWVRAFAKLRSACLADGCQVE